MKDSFPVAVQPPESPRPAVSSRNGRTGAILLSPGLDAETFIHKGIYEDYFDVHA
jgi:hypothetical protein